MEKSGNCYSLYIVIYFIYLIYNISAATLSIFAYLTLLLITRFVSLPNIFLNFKQAIARFPQLVRHQIAGQQTTTAVPITQSCTPAPIRAPGEGGGAQPMRWGITTRCDDPRTSSRTRAISRGVASRVVVWDDCQTRIDPCHVSCSTLKKRDDVS